MILEPYQYSVIAGLILVALELTTGTFIFFGFGLGALLVSLVEFLRGDYSVGADLLIFAVGSAAAFMILRKFFGTRADTKVAHKDINQY